MLVNLLSSRIQILSNGSTFAFDGQDLIGVAQVTFPAPRQTTPTAFVVRLYLTGEAGRTVVESKLNLAQDGKANPWFDIDLSAVENQPDWPPSPKGVLQAVADITPLIRYTPSSSGGQVDTIVPGDAIDVDSIDPVNPIVNVKVDGVTVTINGSNELEAAAGAGITDLTGDVTATGPGSAAATIAANAVTFAKMQAVSANTLLGNDAAGTAVEEIPCTPFARTILDDVDAAAVRATIGAGTGSGDVVGPASATDKAISRFNLTTGKLIQDSVVTVADTTGVIAGSQGITLTGVASPSYVQGKIVYDTDNESLTFYNNDSSVSMQIGQEEWIRVRNVSGSSIPNGSAVYINGANSGLPTIALAQSNAAATTVGCGLTTETIANGSNGYVTSIGLVRGLNTVAFTIGAVYIDPSTPGALTQTVPTGASQYIYRVGFVTAVDASAGTIHVTPSTARPVLWPVTAGGTGSATLGTFLSAAQNMGYPVCVYGSTATLGNMVNALAFFPTAAIVYNPRLDLTGFTDVKFQVPVSVASASVNTPKVILRYFTSASTVTTDYLDIGTSEVSVSLSTAGVPETAWIPLAAGAIGANKYIRILTQGGDGAADPVTGIITAFFR